MVGDVSNQRGWSRGKGRPQAETGQGRVCVQRSEAFWTVLPEGGRYMIIGSGPHVVGGGLEYPPWEREVRGPTPGNFLKYG